MFVSPLTRERPYTMRDRAVFYAAQPPIQPPPRSVPQYTYHDPPRPVIQSFNPVQMHACNGKTTLLSENKYLLAHNDRATTGPYELRRRGLHPRDRWHGLNPEQPEYLRAKQSVNPAPLRLAATQRPSTEVERNTLQPKPLRTIPRRDDLKKRQYSSANIQFNKEWS